MTGQHRHHWWTPPTRWAARHPLPAAATGFGALTAAAVAAGALLGPSPDLQPGPPPITPSIGTAHASGTKPWPTATPPTIGAPGAWQTQDGPVIVDGQPLPSPTTRRPTTPRTTTTQSATSSSSPQVQAAEQADTDPPDPQPGVAAQLLALVNTDRATAGCPPVALNPALQDQSQAWVNQQATDNQMHHSAGVTGFDTWGENVAYGYQTPAEVHQAWMNSPGHRANILNCTFTWMGAAAADGTSGRYWTEQFAA